QRAFGEGVVGDQIHAPFAQLRTQLAFLGLVSRENAARVKRVEVVLEVAVEAPARVIGRGAVPPRLALPYREHLLDPACESRTDVGARSLLLTDVRHDAPVVGR